MIIVDIFLTLLATGFLLWGINYSIIAHLIEDRNESRGNFLVSYMLVVMTIISLVFVAGYSGGF